MNVRTFKRNLCMWRPGATYSRWSIVFCMIAPLVLAATATAREAKQKGEAKVAAGPGEARPPEAPRPPGGPQDRDRRPAVAEARRAVQQWMKMSDEERQKIKDFMAEEFPRRYKAVQDLEQTNPGAYRRHLALMLPHILRLYELRQVDPDAFANRMQEIRNQLRLRELAREYRDEQDQAKRDELKQQIHDLVQQQFDLRIERAVSEINRLEDRLDHLHQRLGEQRAKRDEHVDREVDRILSGELPPFDVFESPAPPPRDELGPPPAPPDAPPPPGHRPRLEKRRSGGEDDPVAPAGSEDN